MGQLPEMGSWPLGKPGGHSPPPPQPSGSLTPPGLKPGLRGSLRDCSRAGTPSQHRRVGVSSSTRECAGVAGAWIPAASVFVCVRAVYVCEGARACARVHVRACAGWPGPGSRPGRPGRQGLAGLCRAASWDRACLRGAGAACRGLCCPLVPVSQNNGLLGASRSDPADGRLALVLDSERKNTLGRRGSVGADSLGPPSEAPL